MKISIRKECLSMPRVKNIGNAFKVCDNCEDLEFFHRPGVCKRSEKVEQLNEIKQCINHDIIEEIIAKVKNEE